MKRRRSATVGRTKRAGAARLFVWESLVLGVFGALASAVIGTMAVFVLNCAHVEVPLSTQLFLMSDTFELSVLPSALVGAVALIAIVSGVHTWAHRAFGIRT